MDQGREAPAPPIGFIGLGTMGRPMAGRLIDAGFPIAGHDEVDTAVKAVVAMGAKAAASAAEAAADAKVVITMLPAAAQVEAATLGTDGALAAMRPGSVLIDMSTIDPETSRTVAAEAARFGVRMLDAPVSGSSAGAIDGSLTIMVGGDPEVLKRVRPILARLGQRVIHCGGNGTGSAVKLANQVMAGVSMVAVAEAYALAEALRIDGRLLFDVATTSSGDCWSLRTRPPVPGVLDTSPAEHDFTPGFRGELMRKDLDLAVETGDALSVPLRLTAAARDIYDRMAEVGLHNRDFSAVFETIRLPQPRD